PRRLAARGARRLIGHTRLARLAPSAPVQLGVERLLVAAELAREVGERLVSRKPDGIVRYVACAHGTSRACVVRTGGHPVRPLYSRSFSRHALRSSRNAVSVGSHAARHAVSGWTRTRTGGSSGWYAQRSHHSRRVIQRSAWIWPR